MLFGTSCMSFVGFLLWFGVFCLFKGVLCAANENKNSGGYELVGYFPMMEMCVNRKFP